MAQIDEVRALLAQLRPRNAAPQSLEERRAGMEAFGAAAPLPKGAEIKNVVLGRAAEAHTSPNAREGRAILYFHGGGYVLGSPRTHRGLVAHLAMDAGIEALALDYRLAPEHPFPAAIDDAFAAYEQLLKNGYDSKSIAIAGDSAGGGLTLATAQRIRDRGLPQPAALALISPWANLEQSGASYASRAGVDPMLSKEALDDFAKDYLQGTSAKDSAASPLFGDFKGLAPMLIQAGDAEVLLSDAQGVHAAALAADVSSTLEVAPDMIHVWHAFYMMLEEGRAAIKRAAEFLSFNLR